ncbi:VOC family protein [Streptomyces sp. H10-C2]|uniref:VOC family protein n=1 Tax=unclassified Streptomyces TaxID=2593676 RepID=UPI0024B93201|nr:MULTISPECIES: VOC family protein [unclassified Streptomyces]MDJ0342426.1 VOC family protein [Streptomyces sp. PH10-H1]MDJ0372281.1 VOC family protein [Streptomyces sp. H10-C2]
MAGFAEGTPCWADAMLPDLDAGKRFYGELFGWTFQDGDKDYGYYTQAFRGDKNVAALAPKPDGRMPTAWNVYFASPDAEATARKIREAGGQLISEPMVVGPFGTMLIAADPGGAVFGVWQPGTHPGFALRNEPGSYCWSEVYTREKKTVDPFYETVFGLKGEQMGDTTDFDFKVWTPPGEEESVAGRLQMGPEYPSELPAHFLVYFAVGNCDEAAASVGRLGGRVTREPRDSPFGRYALVVDDQGASFAVIDLTTTVGDMPV